MKEGNKVLGEWKPNKEKDLVKHRTSVEDHIGRHLPKGPGMFEKLKENHRGLMQWRQE